MKVLPAPLCRVLASVPTATLAFRCLAGASDSLKHRKVALPTDARVIVDEAVRVLHGSAAALIAVFADANAER